jgi:glycosyltransferase involved in cell wall biosynthesis
VPELVEDGVTGFLSIGSTGKDFGEKVLQVIRMSPEAIDAVRKRGRERIENEYNIGHFPATMEKQLMGRTCASCS